MAYIDLYLSFKTLVTMLSIPIEKWVFFHLNKNLGRPPHFQRVINFLPILVSRMTKTITLNHLFIQLISKPDIKKQCFWKISQKIYSSVFFFQSDLIKGCYKLTVHSDLGSWLRFFNWVVIVVVYLDSFGGSWSNSRTAFITGVSFKGFVTSFQSVLLNTEE